MPVPRRTSRAPVPDQQVVHQNGQQVAYGRWWGEALNASKITLLGVNFYRTHPLMGALHGAHRGLLITAAVDESLVGVGAGVLVGVHRYRGLFGSKLSTGVHW